jgi:hypothetical protein
MQGRERMSDDDFGGIFDGVFGKGKQTVEERERAELERNRERNEAAEQAFEKERDRRGDYLHMDQRIRKIVAGEINKLVITGIVIAAVISVGNEYGWPAALAVLVVASSIWWWEDRKAKKLPQFKVEEVDDLAEDTVTHGRIVTYEREGKPWVWVEGEYLEWDDIFDHPYWDEVNNRVRVYVNMPHQMRVADNKAARLVSLPYREAMLARLREQGEDWELPIWARIEPEERR